MTAGNFFKHYPFVIFLFVLLKCSRAFEGDFFIGSVYEHPRQGDGTGKTPAEIIQINLGYYEKATRAAKEYGADVIVFPEYGLFQPVNRTEIKEYLEFIPNPKENYVSPCNEVDIYWNRPILYALSCMAKVNSIVVVANMGGIEYCGTESNCPADGDLHFNTNVAFNQDGTLVGRYYKERLYYEFGMDLPREIQDPTFVTNFGKFAMFICFDIIYEKMSSVSRSKDIDAVFFPAMWINSSPFFVSVQWWQAWALGNNATLLASNIQIPGYFSTGSGIYTGTEGSIASTLNPDAKPKLVIATVPKRNAKIVPKSTILIFTENGIKEWYQDGKDVPEKCAYSLMGPAKDIFKDYRCYSENFSNYTLVKLTKPKDRLRVCNNGMCCALEYTASSMSESFYLGVFNGTHIPYLRYPWSEENCFLGRCDDVNGTACSAFPTVSKILFHKLSLTASFTTKFIFPSILSSKMRLVPVKDWSYETKCNEASINFSSISGIQVISAGLKGRPFGRDPPYQR